MLTRTNRFLRGVYNFMQEGYFVNLSRIDPRQLATCRTSTASTNVGLMLGSLNIKDTRYAMCVSIIHVADCRLLVPWQSFASDGMGFRFIEGDFLVQEFERLLGCLGVVYGTFSFVCDLSASHFHFRTFIEKRKDDYDSRQLIRERLFIASCTSLLQQVFKQEVWALR